MRLQNATCWSQSSTTSWRCAPWCLCSFSPASTPSYTKGNARLLCHTRSNALTTVLDLQDVFFSYFLKWLLLCDIYWRRDHAAWASVSSSHKGCVSLCRVCFNSTSVNVFLGQTQAGMLFMFPTSLFSPWIFSCLFFTPTFFWFPSAYHHRRKARTLWLSTFILKRILFLSWSENRWMIFSHFLYRPVLFCFRIPQKLRISGSLAVIFLVFMVTAIMVKVDIEPVPFFTFTMIKIVCINCEWFCYIGTFKMLNTLWSRPQTTFLFCNICWCVVTCV